MEEKHIRLDGADICYLDEGQGEPVLFVHGLGGYKENWELNVPYFARGRRVVALDLPGFGHSEKPRREYSMDFFVATVKGLLEKLGIERVHLVGNSMGGMISEAFALAHPLRISSLTLVDAAGVNIFPEKLLFGDLQEGGSAARGHPEGIYGIGQGTSQPPGAADFLAQVFAVASGVEKDSKKREQVVRDYIRRLIFYTEPPVLEKMVRHALQEFFGSDFGNRAHAFMSSAQNALLTPVRARLRQIEARTWIAWGDHDALLPIENAHVFQKELPHARLTVFPSCGHCPMLEYPDDFNRQLSAFLGERN
ncbi:MAG: alpha/beta fold hydrolase [Nitrospirae bacterium]|nr:alpha/beta fold hydrolase [Nitrospirota bacterium]